MEVPWFHHWEANEAIFNDLSKIIASIHRWLAEPVVSENPTVCGDHEEGQGPGDLGFIVYPLLIGNEHNPRLICPRFKNFGIDGNFRWPSLLLQIMLGQTVPGKCRAAGYR